MSLSVLGTATIKPHLEPTEYPQIDSTAINTEFQRSKNIEILNGLGIELGVSIIKEIGKRLIPDVRIAFNTGTKALDPYEGQLRTQGRTLLLEKVKEANVEALENSHLEDSEVEEWLNGHSNPELRDFVEDPLLFSQALQSYESEVCANVAQDNVQLLNHLRKIYSDEVVDQVCKLLPESNREQIDEGKLRLRDFFAAVRGKCETLHPKSSEIGELPEEAELRTFLETAQVSKYVPGSRGVFFITGTHNETPLTIVVKAAEKPAQEFFANTLYSQLHINTPKTKAIGRTCEKSTALKLKKVLEKSSLFKEKYPQKTPSMFLVMSCIPGTTVENWKASDILHKETTEPSKAVYDKALVDIGQIAAADFLLYYRDRLPTIGVGNLANLMIHQTEQDKCMGAVAIDQVASLYKDFKKFDVMQTDPIERIGGIVAKIMQNPSEISEEARSIFEYALPDSVKEHLDEEQALASIQKGIVLGLSKIAMLCTPELLEKLHANLPKSSNPRDVVDLDIHKEMLKTIRDAFFKSSQQV
ncbi:MAG: hypothetical protein JSS60_05480 [Verrucomicrobia bacterium]|nr:hypothetical protein [Verrucomicrobiota bacterium]